MLAAPAARLPVRRSWRIERVAIPSFQLSHFDSASFCGHISGKTGRPAPQVRRVSIGAPLRAHRPAFIQPYSRRASAARRLCGHQPQPLASPPAQRRGLVEARSHSSGQPGNASARGCAATRAASRRGASIFGRQIRFGSDRPAQAPPRRPAQDHISTSRSLEALALEPATRYGQACRPPARVLQAPGQRPSVSLPPAVRHLTTRRHCRPQACSGGAIAHGSPVKCSARPPMATEPSA